MKKQIITSVCNFVCALLLVATLFMQFQPFWTCTDCKTHKGVDKEVSIAEYLWIPRHHEPIADEMTDLYRDIYGKDYKDPATGRKFKFKPNDILPAMLTVFLGSVIGIIGCVLFHKKFFLAVVPLAVGVAGILGHLSYPALKVGQNAQLHLILFGVVTAVAAAALAWGTVTLIRNRRAKKVEAGLVSEEKAESSN